MGRKKSEKHWFICKRCNEYIKRKGCEQIYCTPCSYKAGREKVSKRKVYDKKPCENCKLNFEPNTANQKFCNNTCQKEYKIKEDNNAWLTKVEKPQMRRDSNKVAYSFFKIKNNQGWLNNFKVWRG